MAEPKFTYEDRDDLTMDMVEMMERRIKECVDKVIPDEEMDKFHEFMDNFLEKYCTDGWTKFN